MAPVRSPAERPHRLLRWGLPRDPRASEHVLGFAVTTVLTIAVTRGILQLSGFPQIGGDSLHVAHVLWGGLLLGVAVVLAVSFAGPVVRPLVAFVGGIGFGLFIDEVGKFLTQDNDYFFRPAPMIMYVTLVVVMIAADTLHGRRAHHPTEHLAAAADHAVAGLAGGLSAERRAVAEELLAKGGRAPGADQTAALLRVIPDDDAEAPDPLDLAGRRIRGLLRTIVTRRWATRTTAVLLVVVLVGTLATVALSWEPGERGEPAWALVGALLTVALSLVAAVRGWTLLGSDRFRAFQWLRRAVLVNLLLTQVALFRIAPWPATLGLFLALAALGVIGVEKLRLERLHEAEV
ncbi:hypothetical protein [Georgenia subflava]|uniref:Uncharacterized protein n=1 Tax=Georgenia subflava TaxID=1622177 RepID=A0A6N7EPV7_9MICO|nr:hypothetical protein [Georgenia subflava]MPV37254.1 hypothetical protein [Georgenia subflava]